MRAFLLSLPLLLLPATGALAQGVDAEGFRPITDWHAYRGTGVPPQWAINGAEITHTPGGGDLVSTETFANFELDFDWKISAGGNSGVIYRASEDFPAAYQTGPEYQILDNAGHPDGKAALTSAASVYGLYPPSSDLTKPVGEWNSAKIIANGPHVEHWLNGQKVLEYEIASDDWKSRVAASKFAAWPEFATVPDGHIDLQDHGNAVSYRNIRIKPLPTP